MPPKEPEHAGCATLVLDLDETLIHSSYHAPPRGTKSFQLHDRLCDKIVYVAVRPGVAAFLAIMAEHCEIVLFTAATQVWHLSWVMLHFIFDISTNCMHALTVPSDLRDKEA